MTRKPIRVGFDLDGVLLYNPARIARPFIALLKKRKVLINRKELEFYVPKPGWQQIFWDLIHKSSCFIAPGYKKLVALKEAGLIEPYLITGRFGHLEKDYRKWKKKLKAEELFVGCFMNGANEQPHLFKEKMIKKLKLDYFVEDNWDIVRYLDIKSGSKIMWVTNIIDNRIPFHNKYLSFEKVMSKLEEFTKL